MIKQVIVIRKDLKMRRGKEIAQGSHASMAFLTSQIDPTDQSGRRAMYLSREAREWLATGTTKITLQVNSLDELLEIGRKAYLADLEVHTITDAGRTEFQGVPTVTCLAIGPNDADEIDKVTGQLKLY